MQSTVLIVGGNGFIGKNFANYFLENNYKVIVADHNIKDTKSNHENLKFSTVDIHHTKELIKIANQIDFIVWLVHASVPSTQDDSLVDDFLLNVSPIIKFLEKAEYLTKLKKFIYLSSGGTIYGNTDENMPINEIFKQKPISNYGLSKSIAEKYIEYLTQTKQFESVVLRPSNVYGSFQNLVKPQGIIGFAFKAIKDNLTLDLYDNGSVIRDFIYVKDLAKSVEVSLKTTIKKSCTTFYNVGSAEGFSIKQILDKIEGITGKKLRINHKSSRNFDCAYNVLDISKIKNETNWTAETNIDEGLKKVWEWIKSDN